MALASSSSSSAELCIASYLKHGSPASPVKIECDGYDHDDDEDGYDHEEEEAVADVEIEPEGSPRFNNNINRDSAAATSAGGLEDVAATGGSRTIAGSPADAETSD